MIVIFPEHTHYFTNIKQVSYIYDDIKSINTSLIFVRFRQLKIRKKGKDQELIQLRSTPEPGHHMGK